MRPSEVQLEAKILRGRNSVFTHNREHTIMMKTFMCYQKRKQPWFTYVGLLKYKLFFRPAEVEVKKAFQEFLICCSAHRLFSEESARLL